ncbi:hypothetical protein HGRIS_009524 [Hohenbuehelia grisea]|uniref:Sister chromatid cohesion protein Dcc1 n=1 Tax=Hohenbuehelia grisea TaxID=104357 RepID=A0ABR3J1F7_9AGAR
MGEHKLCFSSTSTAEEGSFKLLELPPDLVALIEGALRAREENEEGTGPSLNLQIKGATTDDAVVCTAERTYAMRSVALSNSILVTTSPSDPLQNHSDDGMNIDSPMDIDRPLNDMDSNTIVIRDTVNEIMELVPAVPRLHVLAARLRGQEYGDAEEDEEDAAPGVYIDITIQPNAMTYAEARATVQASEVELERGLREKRVLVLNGRLRPLAPALLRTILELLLNLLAAQGHSATSSTPIRAEELVGALADEHEVSRAVSTQVMGWFGTLDTREDRWTPDLSAIVREIGLAVLRGHQHEPILQTDFLTQWRGLVGDAFEAAISMELLSGNYLSTQAFAFSADRFSVTIGADPDSELSSPNGPPSTLTYFPASRLPADPSARFGDLFLTRARWRPEEIAPFLADVAVDGKERDRLLLKYARATNEAGVVWYTARAQYNG